MNFLNVYNDIKENNGATYSFFTGETPKDGYIVAFKEFEQIYKCPNNFEYFKVLVRQFLTQKDVLETLEFPYTYIGFWLTKGILYIDVVTQFENLDESKKFAIANSQISFYDVKNKTVIYL